MKISAVIRSYREAYIEKREIKKINLREYLSEKMEFEMVDLKLIYLSNVHLHLNEYNIHV